MELQQEEAARLVTRPSGRNPLSVADEVELQAYLAVVVSQSGLLIQTRNTKQDMRRDDARQRASSHTVDSLPCQGALYSTAPLPLVRPPFGRTVALKHTAKTTASYPVACVNCARARCNKSPLHWVVLVSWR